MTRRDWITGFGAFGWLERRGEVYPLRRRYNYALRRRCPDLYRQLGAAAFVHSLPVERLIQRPGARDDATLAERIRLHALHPPALPPAEEILAPSWPRLAWRVARAMEWTHVLHSQLIDLLVDERVKDKKGATDEAVTYYLRDPLAITPRPLKTELLSAFPYSHEFHHAYPQCMGIMMSYHWLQGAQYDAVPGGWVESALARFRELLASPPHYFPLTHKAAPQFHQETPEAGYIFDNLHILHHLAQDILISRKVEDKRQELYRILPLFLARSAPAEWFAAGPQEEPPMHPPAHGGHS
jgi:hypothetical protein